jgi:ligand-binding sensor domain-containing protein
MFFPANSLRVPARILFLLCVLVSESASLRAERLPVRTYTSADGLGSSFVNSLMRDSRGFLWVCTRDGLSRFDGSRFVTYQVGDDAAPPGIEQILETRQGIYWISTTGGLYRFDPTIPSGGKPTNTDRPSLNVEFVSTTRAFLFEDREGNLWSGGDSLYRLEEKDKKLVAQKIELNLPVNHSAVFGVGEIIEGRDRSLWMITSWGLVRRRPDGSEILYAIEPARVNYLNGVLEDSEGRIWLASLDGIFVINPERTDESAAGPGVQVRKLNQVAREQLPAASPVKLQVGPGEIVRYAGAIGVVPELYKYVCQTADKHIWISDANRLIEFDGQAFRIYAEGLIQGSAPMLEDGSGNLWLGNSTGLVRLHHGGLTSYGTSDGLKGLYVITVNQTIDDKVYLLAGGFALSLFDHNSFQTIRPRLPASVDSLWTSNSAFQDSAGEWWFLTMGKLYRFAATKDLRTLGRDNPRATYDHRDGLVCDNMFHIFEDSRRDLWISTAGPGGLSRWSRRCGWRGGESRRGCPL